MIRYRKLGFVELNVSDLDRSEKFYSDIVGLQQVGKRRDGAVLFRCDKDHHSVVLNRKDGGGLKSVGWMLESAGEFENLHRRLKDAGVPFERVSPGECDTRHIGLATRIVEPNTQATFEFYVPAKDDVTASFVPRHTKILQLGHVVFGTPQAKEARAFLRDVLNFREFRQHRRSHCVHASVSEPFPPWDWNRSGSQTCPQSSELHGERDRRHWSRY